MQIKTMDKITPMEKITICDKCGKEKECTVTEYVCLAETSEEAAGVKGKQEIEVLKYLTEITCRLCRDCGRKRKLRFFLFSSVFLIGSLPFFISGNYLEFGFIFVITAVTILLLSSDKHEMEYLVKKSYQLYREENNEPVIHPKIITKKEWESLIKEPSKPGLRIIT